MAGVPVQRDDAERLVLIYRLHERGRSFAPEAFCRDADECEMPPGAVQILCKPRDFRRMNGSVGIRSEHRNLELPWIAFGCCRAGVLHPTFTYLCIRFFHRDATVFNGAGCTLARNNGLMFLQLGSNTISPVT